MQHRPESYYRNQNNYKCGGVYDTIRDQASPPTVQNIQNNHFYRKKKSRKKERKKDESKRKRNLEKNGKEENRKRKKGDYLGRNILRRCIRTCAPSSCAMGREFMKAEERLTCMSNFKYITI